MSASDGGLVSDGCRVSVSVSDGGLVVSASDGGHVSVSASDGGHVSDRVKYHVMSVSEGVVRSHLHRGLYSHQQAA